MYDWANSAFATTVLAGLFPVFFKTYWCQGADAATSTLRLGIANATASVIIVLLAPVLGAIADAGGLGKRLLALFAALGIVATGSLWFVAQGQWVGAFVLFVVAGVGFMGGNVFYDALLVNVAAPRRRDFVSALGFSLGYLGGGLLFATNVAMVQMPDTFGFSDQAVAVRAAFVTVALWWAVFSVPLLLVVREPRARVQVTRAVAGGIRRLAATLQQIRRLRVVSLFLIAYWLYIDGVDTIIRMAVDYGMAIGLESGDLIKALLLTQFVGFPAAIVFGKLGTRVGAKRAVLLALGVYVGVTILAASMTTARTFYALAITVGLVQGGVQALSRSLYSRLIPPSRASEFFGFYNMLGRSAAVIGPLLMGLVSSLTGEPRWSILAILVLLVAGGALLMRVDEAEGARVAVALEDDAGGEAVRGTAQAD
jgi:UMF1 family MFS transporter